MADEAANETANEAARAGDLRISVIVPARDEEASIGALVERLLAQTRRATKIVVADAGSRDRTAEIVAEFASRDHSVRLVRAGASLPGRARNTAIAHASGEWLAFVDAGTLPAVDWLELLAREVERDATVEVVFGAWEPRVTNFFEECAAIVYAYEPPVEIEGVKISPPCVGSTLVRREVWQGVGGFREELRAGEDILFMDEIARAQFRTGYAPRALVAWEMPATVGATFRRFRTYSRHNLRAGLWRRWHRTILTRYALLLLAAVPVVFVGTRWLAVVLALWLSMLVARAAVAAYRKRGVFKTTKARAALRFVALVPLIALIDEATLAGALQWLVHDRTMKHER